MTSAELFAAFPRPWRLDDEELGVVLAADGGVAVVVDSFGEIADEHASDMVALIVALVNGAAA